MPLYIKEEKAEKILYKIPHPYFYGWHILLAEIKFYQSKKVWTWHIFSTPSMQLRLRGGWHYTKEECISALEKTFKENGFREFSTKYATLL